MLGKRKLIKGLVCFDFLTFRVVASAQTHCNPGGNLLYKIILDFMFNFDGKYVTI